jgi:3'(2'), 5'-bisphosphate nucleotidase
MQVRQLLHEIMEIAQGAGKLIMEQYANHLNKIELKEDHSPLTIADRVSHEYICNKLREFAIPIISEESPIPYTMRKEWDQFWLVDPLDGTKDFIDRNDEFTVNIALVKNGFPVLGVIYAPAFEEIYYAETGRGAYRIRGGISQKLYRKQFAQKNMAISRFHDSQLVQKFAEMNNIGEYYPLGSALKFGRLAAREVTVYPRFVGSKEWDIAAGHIIVSEADCRMIDISTSKDPVYNKESFDNNWFIAYCNEIDDIMFDPEWGE